MKKVILAPDSYKGTMSSVKICGIMSKVIQEHYPEAEILKMPIADGGEGTVDCFLEAVGGQRVPLKVMGPYFEPIDSFYGILADGTTAVVEMAAAAGLPLVDGRRNPAETTTYGVGQLIMDAVNRGCKTMIVGLGGSCTNDGGVGMAAALGVRFTNEQQIEFIPTGGTLDRIYQIDMSNRSKLLDHCNIVVACDVDNPLYGPKGAAYIFAPQKGADMEMVRLLDDNLVNLAQIMHRDLNLDVAGTPGAGAAGGLGAGMIAFAGAELRSGIDIVLDTVKFDTVSQDADLVITGEGRIDGQSLSGKAVLGIARRAKKRNIPVVAVVGDIGDDIENIYSEGISAIMSINRMAIPFEEARKRCEVDLAYTMDSLMRLIKIGRL